MLKKIIVLCIFSLFLSSCTGIEPKHLNPIPTEANDGGILQLGKDMITGNWDRFKEDKKAEDKATEKFFNEPLLTETGKEIPVDSFKAKSTKDYSIKVCGIDFSKKNNLYFQFLFEIKDPNTKLEYVKVQSVVPNDVLTFIDETQKNGNAIPNVIVVTKNYNENNKNIWIGAVTNMPNVIFRPDVVDKYLFKFTIKAVGKPEVIIYQPCFLQVMIYNKK